MASGSGSAPPTSRSSSIRTTPSSPRIDARPGQRRTPSPPTCRQTRSTSSPKRRPGVRTRGSGDRPACAATSSSCSATSPGSAPQRQGILRLARRYTPPGWTPPAPVPSPSAVSLPHQRPILARALDGQPLPASARHAAVPAAPPRHAAPGHLFPDPGAEEERSPWN
jgi:hypothetical protein